MPNNSNNSNFFEFTTSSSPSSSSSTHCLNDLVVPFSPINMNRTQGEHRVVVVLVEHDLEINDTMIDKNYYINFSSIMKMEGLNLLGYAFSRIIWIK